MPASKVKAYLDSRGIKYVSIQHSAAFTAPEIAESVHVSGRDFAKTVIVMVQDEMAMVVLPASRRLVLGELRDMIDTSHVRLASEAEFQDRFPDCELGAMPPLGPLYGMPVYVSGELAEEREIAFNAGTHTDVVKLSYADFERLVQPAVIDFITT